MDTAIQEYADKFGVDPLSVNSAIQFIADRVGDFITEENAEDVAAAYIPVWLKAQERMTVQAHMAGHAFAADLLNLIQAAIRNNHE